MSFRSFVWVLCATILPIGAHGEVSFSKDIQPILAQNCTVCHGPALQQSGLRLDLKVEAMKGGKSGTVIEPGNSEASLLIKRLAGLDDLQQMPPGRPLSNSQIALFREWIDGGANWDEGTEVRETKQEGHWAFRPNRRPAVPSVRNADWVRYRMRLAPAAAYRGIASMKFGRYFEEFEIGQEFEHWPGRTINEADDTWFSLMTMNQHPVHIDENYASKTQHGRRLVVGTLVFSIVVGMSVADISGRAIANLDYTDVKHVGPVFHGDTIYGRSRIVDLRESTSKPDRGLVFVESEGFNQRKEIILTFKRTVLVPKRPVTTA